MRNLLRFIVQHHFLILFLLIETFSMFLLFRANPYQKVRFYSFSHSVSGKMSTRVENIKDYLTLRSENRMLAEENARLYNRLGSSFSEKAPDSVYIGDSIKPKNYLYITAKVVNSTVNKQFNFITLDKGSKAGIAPEMAVIGSEGIIGVVKSVSENYSSVLSVLNRDFMVSARIKSNGYFGPLNWNGDDTEYGTLVDIPHHVKVTAGDTVITSGFGGIFPEGHHIGVIADFHLKGGNYYVIRVKLSTDFRKLNYVQVIRNFAKNETDSLDNAASK
jgi:rod shape-determining protein MreC